MPLSFLLIGIAWEEFTTTFGPDKADEMMAKVKGALAADEAKFKDAGLGYTFVAYGKDEEMGRLEGILREGKYDGVCIGFGIRGTATFTPLFERLVNTIHTASPSSRLLFNYAPDSTLEAAKRWFPEIA